MNASCFRGTIIHRITFFRAESLAKKKKVKYFCRSAYGRAHCGAAWPGGGSITGAGRGERGRVGHAAVRWRRSQAERAAGGVGLSLEICCKQRGKLGSFGNRAFLLVRLQGIQRDLPKLLFELADLVGVSAEAVEQLLLAGDAGADQEGGALRAAAEQAGLHQLVDARQGVVVYADHHYVAAAIAFAELAEQVLQEVFAVFAFGYDPDFSAKPAGSELKRLFHEIALLSNRLDFRHCERLPEPERTGYGNEQQQRRTAVENCGDAEPGCQVAGEQQRDALGYRDERHGTAAHAPAHFGGDLPCNRVTAAIVSNDAPMPIPTQPASAAALFGIHAMAAMQKPHNRIPTVIRCAFCWTRRASGVTTSPPASMPAPMADPNAPNRYELACSTSRTYTAIREPNALMANVPAAIDRITKPITGWPKMKRTPESRSRKIGLTSRFAWAGRAGIAMVAITRPENTKLALSR